MSRRHKVIAYRILENVEISRIAESVSQLESSFNQQGELETLLRESGYNEEISAGAFDGERLVAFVLNGDLENTAFIIADGVLPGYEDEILINAIKKCAEAMKSKGTALYKTDALVDNHKAVELYKACGFKAAGEIKDEIFTAEEQKSLVWCDLQMNLQEEQNGI